MIKSLQQVSVLLDELERAIPHAETANPKISKATIGWQIDHSCLVINKITEAILETDPDAFKSSFNKWRFICLGLGWFPRGKARAPKIVKPLETPATQNELQQGIDQAHESLNRFRQLQEKQYMKHPYFGMLDRDTTARFLFVHTQHHIKIIRDMMAATSSTVRPELRDRAAGFETAYSKEA